MKCFYLGKSADNKAIVQYKKEFYFEEHLTKTELRPSMDAALRIMMDEKMKTIIEDAENTQFTYSIHYHDLFKFLYN